MKLNTRFQGLKCSCLSQPKQRGQIQGQSFHCKVTNSSQCYRNVAIWEIPHGLFDPFCSWVEICSARMHGYPPYHRFEKRYMEPWTSTSLSLLALLSPSMDKGMEAGGDLCYNPTTSLKDLDVRSSRIKVLQPLSLSLPPCQLAYKTPSWRPLSVPSQLLGRTLLLHAHIPSVMKRGRMENSSKVNLHVGQQPMQKAVFAKTKRAIRWIPSRRRRWSSGGNIVVVQRYQTNRKWDFTRLWSWDLNPPSRSSETHRSPSLLSCGS